MSKENNYKYLTHKLLRTFYVVAQEQNITNATKKLFVTQPTITLQIQSLERELNCKLFERRGPKIVLTPAGRKLYELIQPIITMFDSLKASFKDSLADIKNSEITIAAGQSTALYILPTILDKFKQHYPNIKIYIISCTSATILDLVRDDKVDIAIGSLATVPYGIDYQPFKEYGFSFITSSKHELSNKAQVTLADIVNYQLILPPRTFDIWQLASSAFNDYSLQYKVSIEVGGWEIVKKYVELNLGVSIISDIAITHRENLTIIPADEYFSGKTYGIISRKGKFLSPQINEFIKLFEEGGGLP